MLTTLTNKKKTYFKMIVNKRDLRMCKLYRPYLLREAGTYYGSIESVATRADKENSD